MSLAEDVAVSFKTSNLAVELAELVLESNRQIHGFAKNRHRMLTLARKIKAVMGGAKG